MAFDMGSAMSIVRLALELLDETPGYPYITDVQLEGVLMRVATGILPSGRIETVWLVRQYGADLVNQFVGSYVGEDRSLIAGQHAQFCQESFLAVEAHRWNLERQSGFW